MVNYDNVSGEITFTFFYLFMINYFPDESVENLANPFDFYGLFYPT
jgi:hypothetical protein